MADFVQFTGPIKPIGSSTFAILEDVFLQGSYRVLEKDTDKDAINVDACTTGMLVKCLDTNRMYSLADMKIGEDEFGDPIANLTWTEFTIVVPNTTTTKALSRWQLSIKTTVLMPSEAFTIKLPFAKSIILERLEVDKPCTVEFKETKSPIVLGDLSSFNNVLKYQFLNPPFVYSNKFTFPDGTPLFTRYTQIFTNKDPLQDKYYYYTVTNSSADTVAIMTKFFVVGIQN
jgi:hypothetical protein